jgi:hypothetical protein
MATVVSLCSIPLSARAWLFEEHSKIGVAGGERLRGVERETLSRLWRGIRLGPLGDRLCPRPFEGGKTEVADCIDFATLSAVGGDHACSPKELLDVAAQDWMRAVIYEARRSAHLLNDASSEPDKEDIWLDSHLRLQLVDKDYLSRAKATGAHFVAARIERELNEYLRRQLSEGADSNAVALYALYHSAALRLALEAPHSLRRDSLLGKALFAEAFALHFLEDAFSAGHLVGSWGSPKQRMGTHDYYCQSGLVVQTWKGTSDAGEEPALGEYVAHGDGHLQPIDLRAGSIAYAISVRQLLFAYEQAQNLAGSVSRDPDDPFAPGTFSGMAHDLEALQAALPADQAERFLEYDACLESGVAPGLRPLADSLGLQYVFERTPRPVRVSETSDRSMAPPRFIRELGLFGRFYAGSRFVGLARGYNGDSVRVQAALEGGAGIGYGPEGVTTRTSDGVFWASFAATGETAQKALGETELPVRSRIGIGARLRLPYAVVPGDLLVAGLLWPFAPELATKWLVYAARGGLWWQGVSVSDVGRLQFMLGREVGMLWLNKTEVQGVQERVGAIDLDLPILEYRPLRLNRDALTSTLTVQLGAGMQIPRRDYLSTAYSIFLRIGLDSRLYSLEE